MLSRPRLLKTLSCCALIFVAAACRAFPVGRARPTATAQATAPVSAAVSAFDTVVWARVPYCGCVDGLVTDNVTAALKKAQLAGTVKPVNPSGGWMYFVVAYDPETASRDQIATAITAGGGEVLAGPP